MQVLFTIKKQTCDWRHPARRSTTFAACVAPWAVRSRKRSKRSSPDLVSPAPCRSVSPTDPLLASSARDTAPPTALRVHDATTSMSAKLPTLPMPALLANKSSNMLSSCCQVSALAPSIACGRIQSEYLAPTMRSAAP